MNIGFFNTTKSWGGGEKWHFETAIHFAKDLRNTVHFYGSESSVLAEKVNNLSTIQYHTVDIGKLSFLNFTKVRSLRKLFKHHELDILIINDPMDLKIASHAAAQANIPRIIYRRGSAIPIANSKLNRHIFSNWVTEILTNSYATKKTILANNSDLFPEHKIQVIYNALDTDFVTSPNAIKQTDKLVIGNLARLSKQKNQKFLIDLSVELKARKIAHEIIIGGIGGLEQELKTYSEKKNTLDTVRFAGFVETKADFFDQIDIFLLPSLWEGFGYALVEAALFEKPTIAFDISSNPEVMQNNITGFLIEKNNIQECIDALIILQDADLRMKFGKEGRAFAQNKFNQRTIYRQLEDYIYNG